MIGYFGEKITFETSDKKVLTFKEFKKESAAIIEQLKIIGRKPLSEFCGNELDTVGFTIALNAGLGINPQKIIDELEYMKSNGIAEPLVIGSKVIGIDKFIIKSLSVAYDTIYNNGFLYSAKVDLSLEEYISDTNLNNAEASKSGESYYPVISVDQESYNNTTEALNKYDVYYDSFKPLINAIVGDLYI